MARWFDAVVFSCDVGAVKPEPGIYHIAMARLGLSVDQCVFVGDGGCHELEGAQAVGLKTIMMAGIVRALWPEKVPARKAYADAIIESLDELAP